MLDLRPVGYVIGLLTATLGGLMVVPLLLDLMGGNPNWRAFGQGAAVTALTGAAVALACADGAGRGLDLRQSFVLTTGVWLVLPLFGALPLMLGAPGAGFTDAMFEAMSGLTTTGTTVFVGLDDLPPGVNLWRAMLQWLGGLGIVIVALIFLPVMKIGGMQFFRTEGFDTLGKVLPRALDIATALVRIYAVLTLVCAGAFWLLGMPGFEAAVHALSTVATGGFSSRDASFAGYSVPLHLVAALFMVVATLPFIRFIQLVRGDAAPLWRDGQVRAYLRWLALAVGMVTLWQVLAEGRPAGASLHDAVFNIVSVMSGTGLGTGDVAAWGALPFVVLMMVGFIGGCTSSTGCSVKVFRYLVMFAAIRVQIRRLLSPYTVQPLRLDGRPVEEGVVSSVIAFFTLFMLSYGVLVLALTLTGLAPRTALTAAWTAIADIGPVFGPEVGPTGAVTAFPPVAKWLMIAGMLVGRLELLSVYVLLLPQFWRR